MLMFHKMRRYKPYRCSFKMAFTEVMVSDKDHGNFYCPYTL